MACEIAVIQFCWSGRFHQGTASYVCKNHLVLYNVSVWGWRHARGRCAVFH